MELAPNPAHRFPVSSAQNLINGSSFTALPHNGASTQAEWQHYSLIAYAVPTARVEHLVPAGFELETFSLNDQPGHQPTSRALISVESFLDNGSGFRFGDCASFEQTKYRLYVRRQGKSGTWLLGTSVGSLTAVAPRHLWSLPWHLSAMEFQVAYDPAEGRYHDYRLQTSSQWANATWEIRDTGVPMDFDQDFASLVPQLPFSLRASTDWFHRRDGTPGEYRVTRADAHFTRGQLTFARCELLEKTGLLTRAELMQPFLVALQHRVNAQIHAPVAAPQTSPIFNHAVSGSVNGVAVIC